jgi:hypothetical protein
MSRLTPGGNIRGGTISEQISPRTLLRPQVIVNGATNGLGLDARGYTSALIDLQLGALDNGSGGAGSTTAPAVAIKVQDSSDDGVLDAYADLATTQPTGYSVSGTIASVATNKALRFAVDLSGAKRYIRVVVTATLADGSGTPGILACAVLIPGEMLHETPITQATT